MERFAFSSPLLLTNALVHAVLNFHPDLGPVEE